MTAPTWPLISVPGTWAAARDGQWADPCGGFAAYLRGFGLVPWLHPVTGTPYEWSGDINGTWWQRPARKHADWIAAGKALRWYVCDHLPAADTRILAHSHGLQCVLYACAGGLKVAVLVTVGSPIREDMRETVRAARPNIGYWLHIRAESGDWMQWFGQLFDGRISVGRDALWRIDGDLIGADQQASVPDIEHTRVLDDPRAWPLWRTQGWVDVLRMAA